MKIHLLKRKQFVNISIERAWQFFSSPLNLRSITPDYMGFEINDKIEDKMYPGQIISYIVKPIFNLPLTWVTEITHVNEPYYFVDEQRFGPYKFWHHKHFINEVNGGVELIDIVHYGLHFGLLGNIANSLIVKKKIVEIFVYREKKINEIFGNLELK
jgi:ligand-binding SRPBCC domain-containing protein